MVKHKLFFLMALMILLAGCHEDHESFFKGDEGNIENVNGTRFSVFHLLSSGNYNWNSQRDVTFELVDPVTRQNFTFSGSLLNSEEGKRDLITCRLKIGETEIPNGTYYLRIEGDDIPEIGLRVVRFSDNIGVEEEMQSMDYSDLEGSGTEADPYLISSQGDFLIMLSYLQDDPNHAYGRYFKQTRPLELPHRSQVIDGAVWASVSFSGHYDGGGFRLNNLAYQGASDSDKDSDIGLFRDIYCATISNLTLTNALITHAASNVGLIAATASGSCRIENVSIEGSIIAGGQNIGGLVGLVDGDLHLDNISIGTLSISESETAASNVGCLIGAFKGGSLSITGVTTPTHIFSLSGQTNVGGLVGIVSDLPSGATVDIKNITLEHSIDQETSDTKIVVGDVYVGGLIGMMSNVGTTRLSTVSLKCPVKGRQDVGAVFGHVAGQSDMQIDGCVLSSMVKGEMSVGGFFGYLSFRDSNGLLTFKGKPSRYIVKSSAAAGVSGQAHTGGLAGYLDGNHGKIRFDTPLELAVNITGSEEVGGAIGFMNLVDEFKTTGLNFSSSTMRVEATGANAGGVVGKAVSSNLSGELSLSLTSQIPSVSDLTSVYSGVVTAKGASGGVAGFFNGTLKGLASDAVVSSLSDHAGGIVGIFTGTIEHCASFGTVSGNSDNGGIIGYTEGSIKINSCLNLGNITVGHTIGGILGRARLPESGSLEVHYCYNRGGISNANCAGGVIGAITKPAETIKGFLNITNCGNDGNIRGKGDSSHSIAGILGECIFNDLYVTACANHGEVSSSGAQYSIGGVCGQLGYSDEYNWITVKECMNSGKISCDNSSTKLGGVVGYLHYSNLANSAEIHDCYNTGAIPSDQKDDTGGILGYVTTRNNIFRTFNRGMISHGNAIIGTHKSGTIFYHDHNYYLAGTGASWPSSTSVSQDRISDKTVYSDFDFDKVWEIKDEGPVLRHCPFQ